MTARRLWPFLSAVGVAAASGALLLPGIADCGSANPPVLIWERSYNSPGNLDDVANGVAVCPDGSIVVVGYEDRTDLTQGFNLLVRKYDAGGNPVWSRTLDGLGHSTENANSVAVDAAGGIVVVGSTDNNPNAGQNIDWLVTKWDSGGTLLWSFTYNGAANYFDVALDVALDPSGSIYVGGTGVNRDWRVAKYASGNGSQLWSDEFNKGGNDEANGVAIDHAGNVVTAGIVGSFSWDPSQFSMVRKYSRDGAILWSRSRTNGLSNNYCGVAVDSQDRIICFGAEYRNDLGQGWNFIIQTYDSAGATLWEATYTSPGNTNEIPTWGTEIAVDDADSVIVGAFDSRADLGQGLNWLIRKYNSSGALQWSITYDGAAHGDDGVGAVAVAPDGTIVAAGYQTVAGQGKNWLVRKYSATIAQDCDVAWTRAADLPAERANMTVCVLGGTLYAIGGDDPGGAVTALVEAYDPATNTWTTRAPMSSARARVGVAAANGKLYAFGGSVVGADSFPDIALVEEYDPGANTWTTKSPLPVARRGSIVATVDGIIYVIGGSASSSRVDAYDPATDTWSTRSDSPVQWIVARGIALNGRIYCFGGYVSGQVDYAYEYDPATDTWRSLAPMPTASGDTVVASLSDKIYVMNGDASPTVVEAYDPVTDSWSTKTPIPTSCIDRAGAALNGRIYVLGGFDFVTPRFRTVDVLNYGGAVLEMSRAAPASVVRGEWFTVTMTVTNTGLLPAQAVAPAIAPSPAGLVALESGPTPPGPVSLNPGASVTFAWTYSASGAGSVRFTVTVTGQVCPTATAVMSSGVDATISEYPACDIVWAAAPSMPTDRGGLGTVAVGGTIYAIGGWHGPPFSTSGVFGTVEAYDTATASWLTKSPMPTPRYTVGTVLAGGKIYAIGGDNGIVGYYDVVEAYDPVSDSWTTVSPMHVNRSACAAAEVDGKVYACGGYNGGWLSETEVYDPSTDTWVTKASIPTPRQGAVAAVVDGKIYVIGGTDGVSNLALVEVYDPATDTWATRASMPAARLWLSAVVMDGFIYAIGGIDGSTSVTTVEAYDPSTDTWSTKRGLPSPRSGQDSVAIGRDIYTVGGWDGSYLTTVDRGTYQGAVLSVYPMASSTLLERGQWVTVSVTVTNCGLGAAQNVMPAIAASPPGLVSLQSGPTPPGPVILNPGNAVTFSWTFSTSGVGDIRFTVTVNGLVCPYSTAVMSTGISAVISEMPACDLAWYPRANMPSARYMLAAAEARGKIYAIGGWGPSTFDVTNEEFDPAANSSSTKAPRPTSGQGVAAVSLGGYVYALGGAVPGITRDQFERYDPGGNTWATMATMPRKRANLAAVSCNGLIYAIGGGDFGTLSSMDAYNPATNTWAARAPMPTAREGLAAVCVNGIIYALGGGNGGTTYQTVEAYDPASDAWVTKAPMPTRRWALSAATVNGLVYAIGGSTSWNSSERVDTVEAYDPVTDKWTTVSPMLSRRFWPASAAVGGTIYTIAGDSGGVLSSVEAAVYAGAVLSVGASVTSTLMSRGQWVTVSMTVTNVGLAAAQNVTPAVATSPPGLVTLESGPTPPGPVTLNPGAAVTFSWTYSTSGAGILTFTATVVGGVCPATTAVLSARVVTRVRDLSVPMNIMTVIGTGTPGVAGNAVPAVTAQLAAPEGGVFDAAGNLYFSDYGNNRIRKVDLNGIMTTVAGTGTQGYNGDSIPATTAQLYDPGGVVVDAAGNLYIPDHVNCRVRKVDTAGTITTIAGTGTWGYDGDGGPATSAKIGRPSTVIIDPAGNLYIGDNYNHVVRKVSAGGTMTTFAGNGTVGYSGDGGSATSAQMSAPVGLAMDPAGNLYIGDYDYGCVRKVDPSGIITTYAGTGVPGYSGDGGPATSAQMNGSLGRLALDSSGNLYVADRLNHRIRKVDAAGIITTVAGIGTAGYSGDGGLATSANLKQPVGVILDGSGNLYIPDWENHRMRKVGERLLMLSETVAPAGPVCAGTQLTYTVSWSNYGTATIAGLTITDTMPAGAVYSGPSALYWGDNPIVASAYATSMAGPWTAGEPPTATGPPLVMRWVVGDVYPGHSGFISYSVVASPSTTVWITLTSRASATILGDRWVTLPPDAKVEAYGSGLTVSCIQTPVSPPLGGQVAYQITVANTGAGTFTNLTITDTVSPVIMGATTDQPAGFPAAVAVSVPGTGTLFSWSADGISFIPGQVYTFTITGGVGNVCVPTAVSNTAWVVTGGVCTTTGFATAATGLVVTPLPAGLSIAQTQTPASPGVGAAVGYRIVVTNTGSATVESVVVCDTVSPLVTAVTPSTPAGFAVQSVVQTSSGTLYSWVNTAPLLPGVSATFYLDGTVGAACVQTTVSNTAYVAAVVNCSVTDMSTSEAGFTLALPVMSMTVERIQSGGGGIGAPVWQWIVVQNTGGVVLDGITIVDTLSPVIRNVSTIQQPPFAAPVVTSVAGSGTRYVWSATGVALAPATALTITVTGQAGFVCAPTVVSGTAWVSARDATACAEVRGTSNAAGSFVPPAVIAISVVNTQVGGGPSGAAVMYTIQVTNTGSATIDSLVVVDTVAGVLVNRGTAQPGGFGAPAVTSQPGSGTRYVWAGGGLNFQPGANLAFTVTGTVGAVCATTAVSNTGYAAAWAGCALTGAFSTVVGFTATGPGCGTATLGVSVAFVPGSPKSGDPWQALVTVSNPGTASADNVTAFLSIDGHKTMTGPTPPGPVMLAPGASQVFAWSGSAQAAGNVRFTATASGIDAVSLAPLTASTTGTVVVSPGQSLSQKVLDQAQPGTQAAAFPNPVKGGDTARIALQLEFGCATEVIMEVFTADFRPFYRATYRNVSAGDGVLDIAGLRQWPPGVYLLKITAKCPDHPDQVFPITRLEVQR